MERRLGRGLGSLLSSSTPPPTSDSEVATGLPLAKIRPNPFQPREHFDAEGLEELQASLEQHGLLQPVVVRRAGDGYELVSGERRCRAARAAGWETIPAIVREEVPDEELLELALIENLQRRDLDPIERAHGFRRMIEELGCTQEAVAQRVGLQRATVANHLRLLELPEVVQKGVSGGLCTMGHARALLGLPGERARVRLFERIAREGLSVREVEARVRRRREEAATVPRPPAARPSWVAPLEARLRDALGTKVALEGGAETGRIVISYYQRADLDRLLEQLAPPTRLGRGPGGQT